MYWLGFPISKVSLYWEPFLFTYVLICDEFVKRQIHQYVKTKKNPTLIQQNIDGIIYIML